MFNIPYVYPEVVIAVIMLTEMVKKYTKGTKVGKLGPKWLNLLVASVFAGLGILYRELFFTEQLDMIKYLISYSLSVTGYDYLVKPIKDKLMGKKVFTEEKSDAEKP